VRRPTRRRRAAAAALAVAAAACGSSSERAPASRPQDAPPPREAGLPAPRTPADRAAWRAALGWADECEAAPGTDDAGVDLFPLDGTRVLAQVRCTIGAYQGSYRWFVADTAARPVRGRPLAFTDVVDPGSGEGAGTRLRAERAEELVGLPTFDAARRELAVERKFRGPGDCGVRLVYAIADSAATLRELRGKLACDGTGPYEGARWPVLPIPAGPANG
jgi:hypothetical protein